MLLHSEQTSGRVPWHRRRRWDLRAWWLCSLTKIRLQLAIYFCLHPRGNRDTPGKDSLMICAATRAWKRSCKKFSPRKNEGGQFFRRIKAAQCLLVDAYL